MVKLGGAELPPKCLSPEPQPNSISAGHDAQTAIKFVGKKYFQTITPSFDVLCVFYNSLHEM